MKSRKQIELLFSEGKMLTVYPYRVRYLQYTDGVSGTSLQAGVAVSRKGFKKAVHRNSIKRLTREAYRLQKLPLQQKLTATGQQLILFFIYTGKEVPEYALVKEKVRLILDKLIKCVEENTAQHS